MTFTPSASDAVDGPLTPAVIVCLPASGSKFSLGKTTVTCSASDSHGNSGHASFAVTVVDTTPPRLNVPVAITMTGRSALLASDSTIAAFLGSANATDLVDGTVTVTNDAPASFPIGKTNVTFTAIDKNGNKTVATSSVTVTLATVPPPPPPDTQPPAPVGKLAARASGGVVALTWVSPPGSDFDHVVVEQSSGGSPLSVAYTGSANSYTAKGLTNGVEYRFVVVSYDKTGNASAEAAIVATPAAPMLVQPKDGAVTTKPPTLTWRAVVGAAYYNVQLYRLPSSVHTTSGLLSGLKVLSVWPTTRTLRLSAKWVFSKKAYRLTPGTYRWYVWPGFGPRADVKYGPSLGQSTFVVRGR
ncbi:MAG TPA: HYR domain-containing protein [Gaiellaceae bacterium]|nr:HYR domain-containing protein [Gaiellaceae bacterium]